MEKLLSRASIFDGYRFSGFVTRVRVKEHERDPSSLVISLARRQKKRSAAHAEESTGVFTIARTGLPVICPAAIDGSTLNTNAGGSIARHVA